MPFVWGNLLRVSPEIPLQSVLRSSSQQAEEINRITNYFFIAAGFILLIVALLTAYMLYKFRDGKKETSTKPLSSKWEIATIGVPSLLVAVFLYFNIKTINLVEPEYKNETPDVIITAHQWWWEANYPSANVITANEIHLPAGKKILLKLLAADVIHDWWIPQFGNKMDMVPTQENYLWLDIKHPGEYYGACSEYCGAQHAHMRLKVIAQNEEDYNNWLQQHQRPAMNTTFESGAQLFMTKTCGNCHRIGGTEAKATIGPDLTHLGSRKTLLAGLLENNIENLTNWIKDPQQIKPGAYMPDFHLDDTTVKSIAAYLNNLK
ncbi:MAG TPA: cytochrome c oxidase subunit II [Flavisolibacter sp.]|jgi:cytochrome c oxidase subunit 2|nr:cytochrome c oxidase subunit II [Flavisolibacter sp.]